MTRIAKLLAVPAFVVFVAAMTRSHGAEPVAPNDNRHAAGTVANGVLTLNLEARTGVWYPEGEHGTALEVAAFAEAGKPMSAPGPMIRVPAGTVVRGTVHNALDKPLRVFGLGKLRGNSDSMIVPVNATAEFTFTASTPGTYYYSGLRGYDYLGLRANGDQQLNGALIVDPPNAPRVPNDRVMVISWNGDVDSASKTGIGVFTMTINGLSWPHTERLDYTQGDSVHWRVINLTESDHPMHLHGFYFRVESKGDGTRDTLLSADQQRMAVTEVVNPFQTMAISWKADRAGNWIFHCHYAMHLELRRARFERRHDGHADERRPHIGRAAPDVRTRHGRPHRAEGRTGQGARRSTQGPHFRAREGERLRLAAGLFLRRRRHDGRAGLDVDVHSRRAAHPRARQARCGHDREYHR